MKMKIKIAEVAQKQGLKTAYALQKALSISPTIASRLWKGEFDKIGIGTLEKLCECFKCQTDDILEYPHHLKSNVKWTDDAQLSKQTSDNDTRLSNDDTTQTGKILTFADVVERLGKKDSSVRRYLKKGRLKGEKVKQEWRILESDLLEWQSSDWFKDLPENRR